MKIKVIILTLIFIGMAGEHTLAQQSIRANQIREVRKIKEVASFQDFFANNPDYKAPKLDKSVQKGKYFDRTINRYVKEPNLPNGVDPVLQKTYSKTSKERSQALDSGFNGIDDSGPNPADPIIAVGPNHIIQMVNGTGSLGGFGSMVQIFDKNGNILLDTFDLESISGIDGKGDPIVLYDDMADRWVITEFNDNGTDNQFIILVSTTADPVTTTWHIYGFEVDDFPDYPKYSIWGDSYLITTNNFNNGNTGNGVFALNRAQVLAGNTATLIEWTIANDNGTFQAATPVHKSLNSTIAGDGYILRLVDEGWNESIDDDGVEFWELDIDWNNASAATLTLNLTFEVADFNSNFCDFFGCANIPQPQIGNNLLVLSSIIMNHAEYRNFGSHESIVATHVVNDSGTGIHAAIRWYEFRNEGDGWIIFQQSTYSPNTTEHRFHSTIGINTYGEIVLSYGVSGASTFPGLRFTGRKKCDALNTMTYPETVIVNGQASFTAGNRLGDYSVITQDPSDSRKFWTNGMFVQGFFGAPSWSTRIASFSITDAMEEIFVDTNAPSNGDGSIANPFNSFVDACNYACDGSKIILSPGTYIENLPKIISEKKLEVLSSSGSAIIKN